MRTISRTIVSAVIISADDKILLGKVRAGGVYPDCWHIPGGGVDEGETKEQALVREIKEELGLDISAYRITLLSDTGEGEAVKKDKNTGEELLVKMQFNVYQVFLPTTAEKTAISLNDDLQEFQWVTKSDLKLIKNTPPSQKLFANLGWL